MARVLRSTCGAAAAASAALLTYAWVERTDELRAIVEGLSPAAAAAIPAPPPVPRVDIPPEARERLSLEKLRDDAAALQQRLPDLPSAPHLREAVLAAHLPSLPDELPRLPHLAIPRVPDWVHLPVFEPPLTSDEELRRREVAMAAGFGDAAAAMGEREWGVETTTFPPDLEGVRGGLDRAAPMLQISRRDGHYDHQVPFLRIVGFFPGTTVSAMTSHLTEPARRVAWDTNYRSYAEVWQFPVAPAAPSPAPKPKPKRAPRKTPTTRNAKEAKGAPKPQEPAQAPAQDPATLRDTLLGMTRPSFTPVDRRWCYHRVASPALERVGVRPRLFLYERVLGRWPLPQLPESMAPAVMVFRTLRGDAHPEGGAALVDGVEKQALTVTDVAQAVLPAEAADDVPVFMHAQEVLLLPVTAAMLQDGETAVSLLQAVERFGHEGNPLKSNLPAEFCARLAHSSTTATDAERTPVGTLMVMTSCNDGGVQSTPRWVQKYVGKNVAIGAYTNLLRAVRADAGTDGASD